MLKVACGNKPLKEYDNNKLSHTGILYEIIFFIWQRSTAISNPVSTSLLKD